MTCDKCKYGVKAIDRFTGKIKYICNDVIITENSANDFVYADSNIFEDCPNGVRKE